MKKLIYLILLLLLSCGVKEANNPIDFLKQNAIPIKDIAKLNQQVYNEISDYEIIMVGEMHGTKEPAEFVHGLCNLLTQSEKEVVLALEIRSSQMNNLSKDMSIAQLKELEFFQRENFDGRNGESMLELIYKSLQNERVIIKFIDNKYPSSTRDSSMYMEICNIRKTYPNTKIVTLTGNVHNSFVPLFNKVRIGGYLLQDSTNFDSKKIMSINHAFSEGNMLNSDGTELKLRTIEREENIYNTTLSYEKFICKKFPKNENRGTHIFYTDKVTASEIVEKDDNNRSYVKP